MKSTLADIFCTARGENKTIYTFSGVVGLGFAFADGPRLRSGQAASVATRDLLSFA